MTDSVDALIPVISLKSPTASLDLLRAAADNGFIFIEHDDAINLSTSQVASIFAYSREFFAAPNEVKAECTINSARSGKNHGWLGPGVENLNGNLQKKPDQKEAFNIGPFDSSTHQSRSNQPLPKPLQPRREEISRFLEGCHRLCNQILTLLAAALEMADQSWFSDRHNYAHGNSSILRLLYYPALQQGAVASEDDIRAGAHSDYGSVTLLFRLPGQPGLEILTKGGDWAPVPVDPYEGVRRSTNGTANGQRNFTSPILVNIGDVLSYWTNGLLSSTVHRVVFPVDNQHGAGDRYSIAYFCHPDDDVELGEIPSPIVKAVKRDATNAAAPIEGVKTAKDHLNARLAATYGVM